MNGERGGARRATRDERDERIMQASAGRLDGASRSMPRCSRCTRCSLSIPRRRFLLRSRGFTWREQHAANRPSFDANGVTRRAWTPFIGRFPVAPLEIVTHRATRKSQSPSADKPISALDQRSMSNRVGATRTE